MKVNVIGGEMEQREIDSYVDYLKNKFPTKQLASLDLKIDGDYVDMDYTFDAYTLSHGNGVEYLG